MFLLPFVALFLFATIVELFRYTRSQMWAERRRLRPLHGELRQKRAQTRAEAARLEAEVDEAARTYRTRRVQELHTDQPTDVLLEVYGIGDVLVRELKRCGFRKLGDLSASLLDGRVKGIGPEKGRAILSFCTRHEVEVRAQVDAEVRAGASVPESLRSRSDAARTAADEADRAFLPIQRAFDMTRFRYAVLRSAKTMRSRAQDVARQAKHSLAPVTDPMGIPVPEVPTPAVSDARDIVELAVAVAGSDAAVTEAELNLVEIRLADLLALPDLRRSELRALLQQVRAAPQDVEGPAKRLQARCDAVRRRLTAEMLFEVAVADGTLRFEEERLLARIFDLLDVPAELFARLRQGWEEATRVARQPAAEPTPEQRKAEWLAALELPADVVLARDVLERAYNRVLQTYREDRFVGMTPEFIQLAAHHRKRADEAFRGLSALVEATPQPPPQPANAAPTGDLRHNPSLDDIFG